MRFNNVAMVIALLTFMSSAPSSADESNKPGSKQMTTTVAVGSQAWKELLGDFRSEAGAEIRLFDENGTLSAKHLKLVGTMAEYEVPPHSVLFLNASPVKGNQLVIHTDECWTYAAKSDCPSLLPYKRCTMTLTFSPDYNGFKSVAKSPQYYSSRCAWALKQPWKSETSNWKRIR